MTPKDHLVIVRKQLKIARDALKDLRDDPYGMGVYSRAGDALDAIEAIELKQAPRRADHESWHS
jgi:hypothetical protein